MNRTRNTLGHNRVSLALHELAAGEPGVRPLLLLHGLGERTPPDVPATVSWPGPVFGLDFTGHGESTVPVGGGYTSELLVGDVDAALQHIDRPATLLGRGLGAYIALLASAARPDVVRGAVLSDGPGLAGGGVHPGSRAIVVPSGGAPVPDPYALMELARDVRPADYARTFAGLAVESSEIEVPIWIATMVRPAWIEAIEDVPGVGLGSLERGLRSYLELAD